MKLRLLFATLCLAVAAQATPPVFYEQVAASFVEPVPEGQPGETFFFLSSPALDGLDVAFAGTGTMGLAGLYCYCDGLKRKVVAAGDPTPRGGTFEGFIARPSLYEGEVVFLGHTVSSTAVYRWHEGTVSIVADSEVPIPGGEPGETFSDNIFWRPAIDENGVTFFSEGETTKGIYRQRDAGGPIEIVIDIHTENPWVPGEMFNTIGSRPHSGNGTSAFTAGSPSWGGVIRDSGGDWVQSFVGGPLPGGLPGETFGFANPHGRPSAAFESAIFPAKGDMGTRGWYRERNGDIEVGLDNHTINPLTGEPFSNFGSSTAAADGDRMAFEAGGFPLTLFLREPDGALVPIATEGEVLDGELVDHLSISRGSLSGNRLGFCVVGSAGEAIYVATVGRGGPSVLEIPTLGPRVLAGLVLLLAVAGFGLLRRFG